MGLYTFLAWSETQTQGCRWQSIAEHFMVKLHNHTHKETHNHTHKHTHIHTQADRQTNARTQKHDKLFSSQ